jgi:hypothetical protein
MTLRVKTRLLVKNLAGIPCNECRKVERTIFLNAFIVQDMVIAGPAEESQPACGPCEHKTRVQRVLGKYDYVQFARTN